MLVHLIVGSAVFAYVFLLPGWAIARRAFPDGDRLEVFAFSLGIGTFGVSSFAFDLAGIAHLWVTPTYLASIASAANVIHVLLARRALAAWFRALPGRTWRSFLPSSRSVRRGVFGVLLPWLFFVQHYARSDFNMNCVNFAPAYVSGVRFGDGTRLSHQRNEILGLEREQREGGAALISAFPALYRYLGYRLFFATTNLSVWLFSYLLGRRLFGKRWHGALFAAIVVFNPLVLQIREIDENLMSLAAITASLYCVTAKPLRPFLGGLFLAFAWGARHTLVLSLGGIALPVLLAPERWRALRRFVVGLTLPTIYFALHHRLAYGSVLHHESLRHFQQPIPHQILGIDFATHTLLAWPFTDHLARSPFAAQPSLMLYALLLPGYFGTLMTVAIGLGAAWMAFHRRLLLTICALVALPQLALLMVMGNWMEPDKVRIFLIVATPVLLPIVPAFELLRPTRGRAWLWPVVLGTAIVLVSPLRKLQERRFPIDPREYIGRPDLPEEQPGDHEFMRQTVLMPPRVLWRLDLGWLLRLMSPDALEEFANPAYEARNESFSSRVTKLLSGDQPEIARDDAPDIRWKPPTLPIDPLAPTRVVEIDLRASPTASENWVREVRDPGDVTLDLAMNTHDLAIRDRKVAAWPDPVDLVGLRWIERESELAFVAITRRPRSWSHGPSIQLPGDRMQVRVHRGATLVVGYIPSIQPIVFLAYEVDFDSNGVVHIKPSPP